MTVRSFLDTNVLVYTDDGDAPEKRERALDLIAELRETGSGVLSTQVLQEYFVAATRKLGVPAATAKRKVEIFSGLRLLGVGPDDILAAIDFVRLYPISFWDALILRAAKRANCSVLYTEDLSSGSLIEGVRVVNPFAA